MPDSNEHGATTPGKTNRYGDDARSTVSESDAPNRLTTDAGCPIADNQNSLTAGPRGPVLLQDVALLEQIQHFNRERIPERVVHAKGSGAYGTLTVTNDITKYTKAKLFSEVGKQTELLVRFSTVAGERGAADGERDVRGFSIKFYTEEGNWDLVGNNTPVFFVRDPYKFQMFIRSQKRHPKTNLRDNDMQWDFWSLCPESCHQVLILMSDRGLPKSYRHMNGYGSHTFSLINDEGNRVWCKFHFKTRQGNQTMTDEQSAELIAGDRESAQRDLFTSIETGDFPKWKMFIQVMTDEQAKDHPENPFDLTKVWPHDDYPLIEVGEFELNKNAENYFAEIEQSAFNPSNIVPGVSFSPDKMLQARLMSYQDAHQYRIGTNYQQLPVNKARCPVMNYQRDGQMSTGFGGSIPGYFPNSIDAAPKEAPEYKEPAWELGDTTVDRFDTNAQTDNYHQPRDLWNLFDDGQKKRTINAMAGGLGEARREVQLRALCHWFQVSPDLGGRLAEKLGIELPAEMTNGQATNGRAADREPALAGR